MTLSAIGELSPSAVRDLCRKNKWTMPSTAGASDGHVQVNLLIIPERYADDFRAFCQRNPTPCPLIGETKPGDPTIPSHLAKDADVRTDVGGYRLYQSGKFLREVQDIKDIWRDDSVAFLVGCSYSFEAALCQAGLVPRHIEIGRNVPMYRTKVPLCAAGVFSGCMVVSMRPYPLSAIPQIQAICRPYSTTHGEPVAWGIEGAKALGLSNLDGNSPDFGDPSEIREGEIPVFWGCGVTPQIAAMTSVPKEIVVGHAPGQMLVLDITTKDIIRGGVHA